MKYLIMIMAALESISIGAASIRLLNTNHYPIEVWSEYDEQHSTQETAHVLMQNEYVKWSSGIHPIHIIHWRDTKVRQKFNIDLEIPWWKLDQIVDIHAAGFIKNLHYGNFLIRAHME